MVIFVAGVHGVGKTYLCERVAAATGIKHSSASSLIKSELNSQNWNSSKLVSDIDSNQIALTKAVKNLTSNGEVLLLDGHFVLKSAEGQLSEIEEGTFQDLSLSAVVLIEAPTGVVKHRLSLRDKNFSAGDISTFLEAEKERAIYISNLLKIPITTLSQPTEQVFQEVISNILQNH